MPTYQFEAMDATGQEIRDVIEAPNEEEAQATIRQMGYFVTKISVKKARGAAGGKKKGGKKAKAPAGVKTLQAQEVGRVLAEVAKEKGITKVRFDRGGYLYHGRVAALAKALRDGGLEF